MLLLTATRRTEAAEMNTSELDGELWTIPGRRYKTKLDHVVPLSTAARGLISELIPKKISREGDFIFSTTGGGLAFSGFSKAKAAMDKAIADLRETAGRPPMENWTLHDLRRTARSLMSRAKVPTDHAERALGHVMSGVRGTCGSARTSWTEKRATLSRRSPRWSTPSSNRRRTMSSCCAGELDQLQLPNCRLNTS